MEILEGWTYNEHTLSIWQVEANRYAFWPKGHKGSAQKGCPPIFPTREAALAAMKAAATELAEREYKKRLRQIDAAK